MAIDQGQHEDPPLQDRVVNLKNTIRRLLTKIRNENLKNFFDPDLLHIFGEYDNLNKNAHSHEEHIKFFLKYGNLQQAEGLDVEDKLAPRPQAARSQPVNSQNNETRTIQGTYSLTGAMSRAANRLASINPRASINRRGSGVKKTRRHRTKRRRHRTKNNRR